MERIVPLPVSIRHAHLPEVGINGRFYRDLSRTFEEISRHLLVTEGLLMVVARKSGVTERELGDAIREIAVQAGEKDNAVDNLLAETEELAKALVGS